MAESNANGLPTFNDADKARARQWFKKGTECRDKRDYDYAIECFITGLGSWPEAVEEGHMLIRSLQAQRSQAGGKKPGMMDRMKLQTGGKDFKHAMLNAETLYAKGDSSAIEPVFKNAVKAVFLATAKWAAPLVLEELKKDAKPDKSRFRAFRDALVEAADVLEHTDDKAGHIYFLQIGMNALEFLIARTADEALKVEQRHLGGRLTIAQGKYGTADSFRDSINDANKQKILHDADRTKQGESTLESVLASAKKEYDENPMVPGKINAYVDALVKPERKSLEDKAIAILDKSYAETRNYSFKSRSDEIRIRQLGRAVRAAEEAAAKSGSEDDAQQARLAKMELDQLNLDVSRERVVQYPTDARMKFVLGKALFDAHEFDEAIPMLQQASTDPRSRAKAQFMMGRAFFEKGDFAESYEILNEIVTRGEMTEDALKETMYWAARGAEGAGKRDEAKSLYGKLLRMDYNYLDARKRLDGLK